MTVHVDPIVRKRRLGFGVYCAITTLFAAVLVALLGQAYFAARDIRGGNAEADVGPTDPGYVAFVAPTPIHLIATAGEEGVVDFLVMVERPAKAGGGDVLWVLGDTLVDYEGATATLAGLANFYGIDVAREQIELIIGMGMSGSFILTPDLSERFFGFVEPLSIDNPDPFRGETTDGDRINISAGEVELGASEVGPYLTETSERDVPTTRSVRAEKVLEALWDSTDELTGKSSVDLVTTNGDKLIAMFTNMGSNNVTFETMPVMNEPFGDQTVYKARVDATRDMMTAAVPSPLSAFPGQRPRSYILSGVAGKNVPNAIALDVGAAGAEVVALGNAAEFGTQETQVTYYGTQFAPVAQKIADDLGVDALESPEENPSQDITIILGPNDTT